MPRGDAIDDVGGCGGRRQGGPGTKEPTTGQRIENGECRVPAGNDPAGGLVYDVHGVGQMAFCGQLLEAETSTRRGQSQRHELETSFAVPATQAPDGLATDAAAIVVQDCQGARPGDEGLVVGRVTQERFGHHGAEW